MGPVPGLDAGGHLAYTLLVDRSAQGSEMKEGMVHMPRFFRLEVDEAALTDAMFEFVTDPRATRNERPVVQELHDYAPEMVEVLENMVLDGVDERRHVADYVRAVFEHGLTH